MLAAAPAEAVLVVCYVTAVIFAGIGEFWRRTPAFPFLALGFRRDEFPRRLPICGYVCGKQDQKRGFGGGVGRRTRAGAKVRH